MHLAMISKSSNRLSKMKSNQVLTSF